MATNDEFEGMPGQDQNNETEWQELMADMDAGIGNVTASLTEWKTGLMNQYLLNEDVSIYDFSTQGKIVCYLFSNIPCCYTWEEWGNGYKESTQAMHFKDVSNKLGAKHSERVQCYKDFGLKHPDDGENTCYELNYIQTTCEEQYREMCLYDKNGIACCTRKLDLVHSWLDKGSVEGDPSPYENLIQACNAYPRYWDYFGTYGWKVSTSFVYHVGAQDHNLNGQDLKTRWNFECPTHHPVPTVAIILGCFIPVMVILFAIIGFQWYRGRQPNAKEAEEEAAVDEIPKSA